MLCSRAVFLNLFRFVTPSGIFTQPAVPSYSFFNRCEIITITIATKCISKKLQRFTGKLERIFVKFRELPQYYCHKNANIVDS